MKRSATHSCRHRAERRGVDGCAAAPGGRPWRLRRLALLFALAVLGWPSNNLARAACSNGLEGVESSGGDVCCVKECGTCGGEGCGSIGNLDDVDCCTGDIIAAGVSCGNGNTAPCIIDGSTTTPSPVTGTPSPQTAKPAIGSESPATAPVAPLPTGEPSGAAAPMASTSEPVVASTSTPPTTSPVVMSPPAVTPVTQSPFVRSNCTNGFPGWQTNEACCSEFCGQCGGDGCGALGSTQCCHDNIINAGLVCGLDTFKAPCIVNDASSPLPSPAPLALETPPPTTPATPGPTTGSTTGLPADEPATPATAAPGGRAFPTAMPRTSAGPAIIPVATSAPQAATTPPEQDANTPPTQIEDETCSNDLPGYQHGVVCCHLSCGQCGGSGCENIAGTEGGSDCCSDIILAGGAKCDPTATEPVVAPCIVGTVDDVKSANEAANAATDLRTSGGGVGGTASTIGIACAVAAAAATAARFSR